MNLEKISGVNLEAMFWSVWELSCSSLGAANKVAHVRVDFCLKQLNWSSAERLQPHRDFDFQIYFIF
jgi:hypothetical protein